MSSKTRSGTQSQNPSGSQQSAPPASADTTSGCPGFSDSVSGYKTNPESNSGMVIAGSGDNTAIKLTAEDKTGFLSVCGGSVSIGGKVSFQSQGSERAEALLFTQSAFGLVTDLIPSTFATPIPGKGVNTQLIKAIVSAVQSAASLASSLL